MEELWEKGEAGLDLDSFSQSPLIIEPDHFQCLFLIMGFIYSIGLIAQLLDILTNPSFGFYSLMIVGLFACLLVTVTNLFFASTVLWTPISYDTKERKYYDPFSKVYKIGIPARTISTGDYQFDMEILINNKMVASAILGYGAVTSFIFIFVAMIRSLGKTIYISSQ